MSVWLGMGFGSLEAGPWLLTIGVVPAGNAGFHFRHIILNAPSQVKTRCQGGVWTIVTLPF
jgi:hypothetical protein